MFVFSSISFSLCCLIVSIFHQPTLSFSLLSSHPHPFIRLSQPPHSVCFLSRSSTSLCVSLSVSLSVCPLYVSVSVCLFVSLLFLLVDTSLSSVAHPDNYTFFPHIPFVPLFRVFTLLLPNPKLPRRLSPVILNFFLQPPGIRVSQPLPFIKLFSVRVCSTELWKQ